MSGFETMHSQVNQLLHPSINPTDSYDPTFKGLPHKKRLSPTPRAGGGMMGSQSGSLNATTVTSPTAAAAASYRTTLNSTMTLRGESDLTATTTNNGRGLFESMKDHKDQWLLHKGKRSDPFGPRHDTTVLVQDAAMVQPFDNRGNVSEVRFGKGFNRRAHSAINAEQPRLALEAVRAAQTEERQLLVRQRHADRERPLNPLTWAPTCASIAYDTVVSRETNYVQFNRTAQTLESGANNKNGVASAPTSASPTTIGAKGAAAAGAQSVLSVNPNTGKPLQPPLYPSTAADKPQSKRVFAERFLTTVGPPATTPSPMESLTSATASTTEPQQQQLSHRVLRYRNEGLLKPKEWGVAQQMKCGDGYVLPSIVPTGDSPNRAARRQIRPQTVSDTRPW